MRRGALRAPSWLPWAKFYLGGYFFIASTLQLFYGAWYFSAAGGLSILFLGGLFRTHLEEKRRAGLSRSFMDFLYSLSASFATGRPLEEAVVEARQALSALYAREDPILTELDLMIRCFAEGRESEADVLNAFARRSGVPEIREFTEIYLVCRAAGGDLTRVVAEATRALMEKIQIEREISVLTAQKRLEGRIISMMPAVVLLFMKWTSPEYLEPLYTTVAGRMVMTAALAGIGAAYGMTRQMTRIEV